MLRFMKNITRKITQKKSPLYLLSIVTTVFYVTEDKNELSELNNYNTHKKCEEK